MSRAKLNKLHKYDGKHCEECGTPVDITRDHIIPKWFERKLHFFGLGIFLVCNEQYLCKECNQDKGGIIDYRDIRVRRFLRQFVNAIEEKLTETEKEIRLEKYRKTMDAKKESEEKKITKSQKETLEKIPF